jgi:hypothetical protein
LATTNGGANKKGWFADAPLLPDSAVGHTVLAASLVVRRDDRRVTKAETRRFGIAHTPDYVVSAQKITHAHNTWSVPEE